MVQSFLPRVSTIARASNCSRQIRSNAMTSKRRTDEQFIPRACTRGRFLRNAVQARGCPASTAPVHQLLSLSLHCLHEFKAHTPQPVGTARRYTALPETETPSSAALFPPTGGLLRAAASTTLICAYGSPRGINSLSAESCREKHWVWMPRLRSLSQPSWSIWTPPTTLRGG